jgi:hypothetical protein
MYTLCFTFRILKKEKLKLQLKEFEELKKKNPEEALEKLEALEKARALERHTLRHKSTGKWAKNKLIRAKYDKDVSIIVNRNNFTCEFLKDLSSKGLFYSMLCVFPNINHFYFVHLITLFNINTYIPLTLYPKV